MDWEPAEGYAMDIDEKGPMETPYFPIYMTQEPFSSANRDVYMAPTAVQEVHMASPIFDFQHSPPIIEADCSTFFLPPLEMHTEPIIFPPLKFPAASRQALGHRVILRETKAVTLDISSSYQVESPTMASANSRCVTYTSAAINHGLRCTVASQNAETVPLSVVGVNVLAVPDDLPIIHIHHPKYLLTSPPNTRGIDQDSPPPSNPECRPASTVTLSLSNPNIRDASAIVMPVIPVCTLESLPDILEERLQGGQIGDTCAASLSKSSISAEWPDRTVGDDIAPSDGKLFVEGVTPPGWPEWVVEQDVTPSTPHSIVAETNTPTPLGWPDWIIEEDTTSISQYPVLESTTTPLHWPQKTVFQEYADSGVDLIGLSGTNSDSPKSCRDNSALRAFGGSSLEDLDWILEGFRATNVPDAYIAFKNASNAFESITSGMKFVPASPGNFSRVSPYDWAHDLISFNAVDDLRHHPVETAPVPAATHSGPSESPSFKYEDVVQTELNGLFQTLTLAPCDRSVSDEPPFAAAPTLDNMASPSTPEIVITTCDSQSSFECSPVSDTSEVQSRSPFNPIYHHGNTLVGFSKAAYTVEINTLRNVKAFKSKLSSEVQKLRVRTKNPSGFLKFLASSSQELRTTHVGKKSDFDIEHDVFGKIAEVASKKRISKSTRADASTQTENSTDAAYSTSFKCFFFSFLFVSLLSISGFHPLRQYSPYLRYFPYRRLGRDLTFDSSGFLDLENAQHIKEESHCTDTSCVLPFPEKNMFLGCSPQRSINSERELEVGLTNPINERVVEEVDQEKEMIFPGAYPIEQEQVVYVLDQPAGLPAKHIHVPVKVVQKNAFEAEIPSCLAVERSVSSDFEGTFFRFFAYLFGW